MCLAQRVTSLRGSYLDDECQQPVSTYLFSGQCWYPCHCHVCTYCNHRHNSMSDETLGHVVASPRHAASCTSRLFRVEGTGRTPLSPARNRVSAAPLTPSPSSNTAARALGREVSRASRARAPHSPGATGRGGNRPRLARLCLSRGVAAPWRKPPPCLQATGAGRGEERRRQPGRAGAPGAARRPLPRPCARSPRRPWK